jgi:hypothetical protein
LYVQIKNLKYFLFPALLVLFLSGCDCFCSNNRINPAFIGFSKFQIDTIILRRFQPNENFANLIDTIVLTNPSLDTSCCNLSRYSLQGDTTIIFTNYDTIAPIRAGYDWQIYIPATGSTIKISDIENGTQKNCKYCPPNIVYFDQNADLITDPFRVDNFNNDDGYRVYIRP